MLKLNKLFKACFISTIVFALGFIFNPKLLKGLETNDSTLIQNIDPESIENTASYGTKTFYTVIDGNIMELWVTEGTAASRVKLMDIDTDFYAIWDNFIATDNALYFTLNNVYTEHAEVWVSDGTVDGTKIVKDIIADSEERFVIDDFFAFEDKLYFITYDNISYYQLWMTDGTEDGTQLVQDEFGSDSSVYFLEKAGDKLYFEVDYYDYYEAEIWYVEDYDATYVGYDVFSIDDDQVVGTPDGKLYFYAENDEFGGELWMTDGTEDGIYLVKDINEGDLSSDPYGLIYYKNKVYFGVEEYFYEEEEDYYYYEDRIYVSDGTEEGTHEVSGMYDLGITYIDEYAIYKDNVYFTTDTDEAGDEIWVTDFTEEGTHMLKDLVPGAWGSEPFDYKVINDNLYFFAFPEEYYSTDYCVDLWESDGTANGTKIIESHIPNPDWPAKNRFYSASSIYFLQQDNDHSVPYDDVLRLMVYTPEEEAVLHTVTFKDYNGSTLKTETVEEGESATAPTPTPRSGYTFKGWDKTYNNVTSDLTVTATYTKNVVTATTTEEEIEEPVLEINSITSTLTETEVDNYNFIIQEKAGSKTLVDVYDINLLLKGQKVQPDGTLEIRILMTDKQKNYENLEVLYIDDNNNVTVMPHTIDGNYIVFTVNHLSKYVLVGDVKEEEEPVIDIDDKEAEEKDINPIIYIAAGALILVIIIIIFIKKKKKTSF